MDGRSFSADGRQAALWQTGCRVEGLLVCIALGTGVAALLAVSPGAPGSRWERFGLFAFFALWIVLPWFLAVCAAVRPWRTTTGIKTAVALSLLLAWSLTIGFITYELMQPLGLIDATRADFLRDVAMVGAILTGSLALAGWQASRLWHWRTRTSTAEAEAMEARLQPHFLFNSLNGISELVATDSARAERMIGALSRILRASLDAGRTVPLEQELALVRDYVALESMRLDDRLRVVWTLPEQLPDIRIPSLCLQTLVENAVRHGIARRPGGGELKVHAEIVANRLITCISNELAPDENSPPGAGDGSGIGLASTRARLLELFGSGATLETARTTTHYLVRMSLPLTSAR